MRMQPGHRIIECPIYTSSKGVVVTALTIALFAAPVSVGWAQGNPGHDPIHSASPTQFGIGAASVVLSIPYGAAKITYAALGAVIGGFTYLFSAGDKEAAKAVWTPSLNGTYVLTPDHLKGDKPIQFLGRAEGDDVAEQAGSRQSIQLVVTDTR